MDAVTARPHLLKQINLALIRRVIKTRETATRAEIAQQTNISSTTVRSLLAEMLQNGEIESMGYDASSGGRKAQRYRFQPERYYGAAFCITDQTLHALLVNLQGEIVETTPLELSSDAYELAIFPFLDKLVTEKEIKAIGLGLPGIVEGGSFWRKCPTGDSLYEVKIGDIFAQRYGIPVVLENDMNATAIGFGRCYAKQFPEEDPADENMVYLHFEPGCVSAGFIVGGRILRGHKHFAGELGLIPVENDRLLDDVMSQPMEDQLYIRNMIRIISWICGILNPQYVALAGPALRKHCIAGISDGLSALLPGNMAAEILYSQDVWHDYHDGMASLTADKIFDEVPFA